MPSRTLKLSDQRNTFSLRNNSPKQVGAKKYHLRSMKKRVNQTEQLRIAKQFQIHCRNKLLRKPMEVSALYGRVIFDKDTVSSDIEKIPRSPDTDTCCMATKKGKREIVRHIYQLPTIIEL